jgi:hypothetical protein
VSAAGRRGGAAGALPATVRAGCAALLLAGCAGLRAPPPSTTSARAGWRVYSVGALQVEAPEGWSPSGDGVHLTLAAGEEGRLEVWRVEAQFADSKACLAAAERSLARGDGALARVRRHATTLAGRPAVMQEADVGGWHGWAYALCDGGVQHRLFFTGRTPIAAALLETWREVLRSVRRGGVA